MDEANKASRCQSQRPSDAMLRESDLSCGQQGPTQEGEACWDLHFTKRTWVNVEFGLGWA